MTVAPGFRRDLISGLSVFFVAVPLCLGVAQASGTSAVSGLVSGIVGALVVGSLSGSQVSVSGPAAGLAPVVAAGLVGLEGDYRAVLSAVVLAGLLQLLFGKMRIGILHRLFPSPVIKGMLAAIGLMLVLKQIPHLLGYDMEAFGSEEFSTPGAGRGNNTFGLVWDALGHLHPGACGVGFLSLLALVFWERYAERRVPAVPGPLVAVLVGVGACLPLSLAGEGLSLRSSQLIRVPDVWSTPLVFPAVSALANPRVYVLALSLALIASLETLLALEAVARLAPSAAPASSNRELVAQGYGNVVSGLLGALPVCSVIVRSSVNVAAGARSRLSAIFSGCYLLLALLFFRSWINLVPLSALAAILVFVGGKMASPVTFRALWGAGRSQWVPYLVTAVGILLTDLLIGVCVGLVTSALFIMRNLYRAWGFDLSKSGRVSRLVFHEEVTFFHKARLVQVLERIQPYSIVELDGSRARTVDRDIIDTIQSFRISAAQRNIDVIVGGIPLLDSYTPEQMTKIRAEYDRLIRNNEAWVEECLQKDPHYFQRQSQGQTPHFLFIGCSDSRVPAETITKTDPGNLFVHRNIANLVSPHDVNLLSVLQYSVEVLNVPHIIVCGHYGCGGVRAALANNSLGLIDNWIQPIKLTVNENLHELNQIEDPGQRERRIIELHVLQQVRNLLKTAVVQRSVHKLGTPFVHGWVYDLETGKINDLRQRISVEDINSVFHFKMGGGETHH